MKSTVKTILVYLAVIAVIILVVSQFFQFTEVEPIRYDDVVEYFKNDQVKAFKVSNTNYLDLEIYDLGEDGEFVYDSDGKIINPTKKIGYRLQSLELFHSDLSQYYLNNQNLEEYDFDPPTVWPWWVSFLPYAIVLIVFIALWFYALNQAAGGRGSKISSFGKARVKVPSPNDKDRKTFKDVAGADEEKAELEEIVAYLKDPVKFSRLGAKIPHGVLLVGPPGTGKTLLAKAVAGEAGVPFFSISGSDFVEMYVGVGASRVRDLFETARKAPASIVFIDEIDAVGRHRGAGLGGGHDEREQTLNQLLVEMDGFGSHDSVIVIAATNRPDILDPALLRPGRFDRTVTVNYPDIKGREEILKIHARNKPLGPDVDLTRVAQTTAGFTGADLENLLNEAALLAARRGKNLIDSNDIEDSFIKVMVGTKKRSRRMSETEKRNTAFHEAGHAILAYLLPRLDPVHHISIIPSGRALGYTLIVPEEDKFSVYRDELHERICEMLGGRAAEEIMFGNFSGGAANDIEKATDIARRMVTQLGMSDLIGPINYSNTRGEVFLGRSFVDTNSISEAVAAKIDAEIQRIITEAYQRAKQLLTENIEKLKFIAEFLIKNEVMDADQFKRTMESTPTFEELEEIAAEKKRRRAEANREKARRDAEQRALGGGDAENSGQNTPPPDKTWH
ncbi:MAG TPA: ATP-dependent zinc metalloprotease FtsH [Clostridiales bacterium]|jgi:cell division protease FtsH|nr:ATP-dependent zinc metalloprotease FtsH [Clostridiales bacterium]